MKTIAAVICLILLVLFVIYYFNRKENMINESAWLEMQRGYNVSNANGYYVPVVMLAAAEHAGKTSDVVLR
jgi:hypothetical protein